MKHYGKSLKRLKGASAIPNSMKNLKRRGEEDPEAQCSQHGLVGVKKKQVAGQSKNGRDRAHVSTKGRIRIGALQGRGEERMGARGGTKERRRDYAPQ